MNSRVKSIFERSLTEQLGVWLISVVLIFSLFWFLLLEPQVRQVRDLRESIRLSEEFLAREPVVQKQLSVMEDTIAKQRASESHMAERLLAVSEVDGLLTTLSEHARAAGLVLRSFERQRERQGAYFVEIPLRISLEGHFDQLQAFFGDIQGLSEVVTVSAFSLKDPKIENDTVILAVDCILSAYRSLSEDEKGALAKRG